MLIIEPRDAEGASASPAILKRWHERLVMALDMPGAFARFLSDQVEVATYEQPSVQLAVRLFAQPNIGSLVDITSFTQIPGSVITSDFPSYFIAERDAGLPAQAAVDMLRTWCDHALHVDGYEEVLARLG